MTFLCNSLTDVSGLLILDCRILGEIRLDSAVEYDIPGKEMGESSDKPPSRPYTVGATIRPHKIAAKACI